MRSGETGRFFLAALGRGVDVELSAVGRGFFLWDFLGMTEAFFAGRGGGARYR